MGDDAERMRALAKEVIKHCDLSIPTAILGQGSRGLKGRGEVPEFFSHFANKKTKFLPLSAAQSYWGGISTTYILCLGGWGTFGLVRHHSQMLNPLLPSTEGGPAGEAPLLGGGPVPRPRRVLRPPPPPVGGRVGAGRGEDEGPGGGDRRAREGGGAGRRGGEEGQGGRRRRRQDQGAGGQVRRIGAIDLFLLSRVLALQCTPSHMAPFGGEGLLTYLCNLEAGYGGVWATNFSGAAPGFKPLTFGMRARSRSNYTMGAAPSDRPFIR